MKTKKFLDFDTRDMILTNLGAILIGIVCSGLLLLFLKINPIHAFFVSTVSVFTDSYILAEIFVKSTPLILTGLAFAFTYKANLFNIGAQGQFYSGVMISVAVSLWLGDALGTFFGLGVVFVFCSLMGCLYGGLIGFFKAKKGANEFLVSMMSTYVAVAVMNYLLRVHMRETRGEYPQTDVICETIRLPLIWSNTRLHFGFLLAVLIAILLWILLFKTPFGFRVRAVGSNAPAAIQAGIDSEKMTIFTFAISGMMGALAGFVVVNGAQFMAIQGFYAEVGALGIGIAILANGNPLGVIFAAILFGAIQVVGGEMSMMARTPESFTYLMLGSVTLFVIIAYYVRKRLKLRREKLKMVEVV